MPARGIGLFFVALLISGGVVGLTERSAVAGDPCYLLTPTIVATGGVTNGTSKKDVFVGESDGNTIDAGAGDDIVCVYGQNNVVYGGSGNDTLYVSGVGDSAYGESGNDRFSLYSSSAGVVDGGSSNDSILGNYAYEVDAGAGNDEVYVEPANYVDCGSGRDRADVYVFNEVIHCEIDTE